MRTTVVTAYYRVRSKQPPEQYLRWIENFMAADFEVVIFGDDDSLGLLRDRYPETERRRYRRRPIDAFVTSRWSWEEDARRDPERAIHSTELYRIWNEKIFFVREVVNDNPFATEAFAWVDIGCVRDAAYLTRMAGFPDGRKFDASKVSFLVIEPFQRAELQSLSPIDERFLRVNRVGGTIFAGGGAALRRLAQVHEATIEEAKARGVFAGKDQSLYAFEMLRHPDLICPLPSLMRPDFDPWFQLLWRWASEPLVERGFAAQFFLQRLRVERFERPKLEFFAGHCAGQRVLHVGCTDHPIFDPETNLHLRLAPLCARLDGVDPDAAGLAELRRRTAGEFHASVAQVRGEYDVVLAPEVIEHVPDPGRFLAEIDGVRARKVVITAPCLIGHFLRGFFNYRDVPGRHADFLRAHAEPTAYLEEVHPDHNCWHSPYTLLNTIQKLTSWKVEELVMLEGMTMVAAVCSRPAPH